MRLAAVLLLVSSTAYAGSHKDDPPNSGGRLGSVSSGIDRATPKPPPVRDPQPTPTRPSRDSRDATYSTDPTAITVVVDETCCYEAAPSRPIQWPKIDVDADGFAGAQKVVESNGSLNLELGLVFSGSFKLTGAVSHYFEDTMPDRKVTMNVPSLTAGVRLAHNRDTRVWLEGGVVHVATNDPAGSSAITGSQFALRVEHAFDRETSMIVTGGGMLFSEIQAMTARAALRIHHVELGVRYVDFTVGPPLWGPEVGIGF